MHYLCRWLWSLFLPIFLCSIFVAAPSLPAQEIHSAPQPLTRLHSLLSGVWCQPLEGASSYEILQYSCEELASICEELADLIEQDREENTPDIRRTTELLLGLMQRVEPYLPLGEREKWTYEVATFQLLLELLDESEPIYGENGWRTIPCKSKSFWKGIGDGLASAKHEVVKAVRHLGREIREHPVRSVVIAGAAAGLGFGIYLCCNSSEHVVDPMTRNHVTPPEQSPSPPRREEKSDPPSDERREIETLVFDLVAADAVQDVPPSLAGHDPYFLDETSVEARFAIQTDGLYQAGVEAAKGIAHGAIDFQWRTVQDLEAVAFLIGSGEVEASFDERRMVMDSFLKSQASREVAVESWVQDVLNIDPSDPTYQQFRSGTETTLEIGSIALGAYGVGKGIMKIGTRMVVAELGEVLYAGRNIGGELALAKECTAVVHQLEKGALAEVRAGRLAVNELTPAAHQLEKLAVTEAHTGNAVRDWPLPAEKIRSYLSDAKLLSRDQIIRDLESIGFKIKGKSPDGRFIEFQDELGNVRVKMHPPDRVTEYNHLHIYDQLGNPLNKDLELVDRCSHEAHILFGDSP